MVVVLPVNEVMWQTVLSLCRMDVEVIGAGRASTWRRGAEDEEEEEDAGGGVGGGGGVEAQIVPLDLYDSARAKIEANLRWLFAKAYGIGKALFNLLLLPTTLPK